MLDPQGRALTDANIGEALASREASARRPDLGIATGGPAPFQSRDRSHFLQRLDALILAIKRHNEGRA